MTERRADAASYDVQDWLKCEYVQDRVGDEFRGTVSSVTGFGLFVQLSDIYVEGLVHITALKNDYYQFDPVRQMLRGEHSGVSYRLGDPIMVKVARVDLDERKIDLQLVDGAAGVVRAKPDGKGKGKGKAKDKVRDKDKVKDKGKNKAKGNGAPRGRASENPGEAPKAGRSRRTVVVEATHAPVKKAPVKKAPGKRASAKIAPDVLAKPAKRPRSNAKRRSE